MHLYSKLLTTFTGIIRTYSLNTFEDKFQQNFNKIVRRNCCQWWN